MKNQQSKSVKKYITFNNPYLKSTLVWICTLFILALAGKCGEFATSSLGVSSAIRLLIQGVIMSGLLIPIIWYLTMRFDLDKGKSIGFQNMNKVLWWGLIGAGLILTPMILTLVATHIFGWGRIGFNDSLSIVSTMAIGIISVLLFEAIPEELAFRGYIFSQLNSRHNKWLAGGISVLLFVLLPVTLYNIQSLFFTDAMTVGGQTSLSGSYVMTMLFFGSIVQYLRIITHSVWTGVGFHLAFIYSDRLVGIGPNDLIIISGITNETIPQILLISLIVLILILFIRKSHRMQKIQ